MWDAHGATYDPESKLTPPRLTIDQPSLQTGIKLFYAAALNLGQLGPVAVLPLPASIGVE